MLQDLLMMRRYFDPPSAAVYEEDIAEKYGEEAVLNAIRSGLLEHRRIPCGKGRTRCVCWLSVKGEAEAARISGS